MPRFSDVFVRYIIKNSSSPNKSKDELLFSITKITLLLSFFLLSLFNCSKKEIISETITETIFVTKKDAFLYGDLLEKNIIDEIPAFIKIKTKEKTILKSKSNNDKI